MSAGPTSPQSSPSSYPRSAKSAMRFRMRGGQSHAGSSVGERRGAWPCIADIATCRDSLDSGYALGALTRALCRPFRGEATSQIHYFSWVWCRRFVLRAPQHICFALYAPISRYIILGRKFFGGIFKPVPGLAGDPGPIHGNQKKFLH